MTVLLVLLTWYLIGMVSYLIGEKIFHSKVTLEYFVRSLGWGFVGPIVLIILIIALISEIWDKSNIRYWWNKHKDKELF